MDPNRRSEYFKFYAKKTIEVAETYKVRSIGNESKQNAQNLIGYCSWISLKTFLYNKKNNQ